MKIERTGVTKTDRGTGRAYTQVRLIVESNEVLHKGVLAIPFNNGSREYGQNGQTIITRMVPDSDLHEIEIAVETIDWRIRQ